MPTPDGEAPVTQGIRNYRITLIQYRTTYWRGTRIYATVLSKRGVASNRLKHNIVNYWWNKVDLMDHR